LCIVIIYIWIVRNLKALLSFLKALFGISAMLLTFVGTLSVLCLKSKCKKCNICFGLISVEQDIDGELEDEKIMIENRMDPHNIT
jgi:energy-converting hydrogenase Eha subunit H